MWYQKLYVLVSMIWTAAYIRLITRDVDQLAVHTTAVRWDLSSKLIKYYTPGLHRELVTQNPSHGSVAY